MGAKPWDAQSNIINSRYDQKSMKRFYQIFTEMFATLFSFDTKSQKSIPIHAKLLYDIGLMVKDNLIKTKTFNQIDLKMKLIESMRHTFSRQTKLENIYVDSMLFILDGIENGSIGDEV